MGTWEREDSRITLGFLVPVTLWPMVPYLETQNIVEDTGLEQRKGKRWRWAGKGNGALFSSRHVEIEVPMGQPMKCPILMGPEVWSSEERSMAMDTGLEWEKTSQKKQVMSWEPKNDLERARWTGRGRDSGGRHCLHKDPKAWEKLLLFCLAFILKTMKKMEIPAKCSAPTSACFYCESPGGLAEREHGQCTRDPATATKQKPVVFSCQPWAAKQQTQAKKRAKAVPRMNFLWNITNEKQNPLNLVTAPDGIKRFLWNYSQISKTIIRITKWIDQNSIEKIFTQAKTSSIQ